MSRYVLEERLGEGAMGDVWRARHVCLHRRVAIKVMKPSLADDALLRARFLREAEAASRVRHPNVVEVYDVGEHEGVPYLVMEHLEGEPLTAMVAREGALPPAVVADLMLPVLAAVAVAHEVGVVHRDLKPDNIFVARAWGDVVTPKVLDFGISRVVDDRSGRIHTLADALLGTPAYMSPEQARGERVIDDRSDQYALGAVLYECATGVPAFDDAPLYALLDRVTRGAFEPPRARRPELPVGFEAMVLRAMSVDPRLRFRSVRSLGATLLPYATAPVRAAWAHAFDVMASAQRDATMVDGPIASWQSDEVAPAPAPVVSEPRDEAESAPGSMPVPTMRVTHERGTASWLHVVVAVAATLWIAALVAHVLMR